ncbi:MAG: Stealth CR1 domain-containing protein, partial [Desulfovibrio sp.]|nr:Stealth CR1 domain-containing protein [Desulfovibrio sp.]
REDVPLNDWASACTGHGCYAHTRQNSADFLSVPERRSEASHARGYATALFRWTYAEARAVLVPLRADSGRAGYEYAGSDSGQARAGPDPEALFLPPGSASFRARLRRRLYALCTELHPASGGCGPCGNFMPSLEKRVFHGGQPEFPVDVVYTWVNGADPAHAAERARYLREQRDIHENGLEQARFRDNEELRYSMRALERCAPWVRSVILVTDRQIPAWLKRDHPSVRIADHTEFIPARFLPTFNSHVIEAWLHEIPGLAEHYIYLNDDVFLARPCRKTEFFTPNGLPLAFTDWRKRRLFGYAYTKTPHAQSYFNTLRILRERGVSTDPKFITAHGPYPQTRSNAAEAFAFYRDVIEGFAGNRFRTTRELALYSHALPLLLYRKKRLVPCDERYYYIQTRRRDRAAYYKAVLQSRRDGVPPLFFCINDVGGRKSGERSEERHPALGHNHTGEYDRQSRMRGRQNPAPALNDAPGQRLDADDGQWRRDLRELLEAYYPDPSGFETAAPLPDGEAVTM